jgi:uncharacterized protein YoxC
MKRSSEISFQKKVLIVISFFGIIFSAAGLASTWIIMVFSRGFLIELLGTFNQTLMTTQEGLNVLDESVALSIENMDTIETSMEDLSATLDDLSTSLFYTADLIGDDLQLTIEETQTALSSAAASAVFIDDTLAFIASIPLIGADYQPDVPLHTSLEQAAASLEGVPESLEDIEQSLNTTAEGLDSLNDDLESLTDIIINLDDELDHAASVIESYQVLVEDFSQKSAQIQEYLTLFLIAGSLIFSGIFFWLGFTQVIIFLDNRRETRGDKIVNLADIRRE